ncbi:MAG: acetoacetate--CoA ligase [Gammaproteobacteria bacterium]
MNSVNMVEAIWIPSTERIEQANLTAFRQQVEKEWGIDSPDYPALYAWSIAQPAQFWQSIWKFTGVIAASCGDVVLENGEQMLEAKWFPQARLNYAENLLRHRDDTPAILFWGEDRIRRSVTRNKLYAQVSRLARALSDMGIGKGDRVAGFMPNMPESVMAMLATASLGAIWSSCSPDFGAAGVLDRFGQIRPKVLFSADGYTYNGKWHSSLPVVEQIAAGLPSLQRIIIAPYDPTAPELSGDLRHTTLLSEFIRDYDETDIRFTRLPFDHPLFILFSSGTTGVPKCIVHSAGGTLLQHLKEHQLHTDIRPGDRLFYFTTCGWMMWNWLVSALASEATIVLYDGSPFYPDGNVLFDYIDAVGITHLGTSAKFIDAVHKAGLEPIDTHSLASLRTILSTGSPLAPESFDFVYQSIKDDVCLSSISGGTDIISCFALGNPVLPVWRGELQCRGLGMKVEVFSKEGKAVTGEKGELVCTAPFPSMPVGFWDDPEKNKYRAAYFERYPGVWCHGDYVALTGHGGLIIYGRSDTVLNPGGVRIGTAEIYRQVEALDEVVESLAIGQEWQGDVRVILFVRLRDGVMLDDGLIERIKQRIRRNTTARHVPARIIQVSDIPRTRSGKTVELAVRNVVHNQPVRNKEALANPQALELFKDLKALQS